MTVSVMIAFARSGGTVLNQCLGSLPDVVIMSEVNPLGGGWGEKQEYSLTSVQEQAKHWYQIELGSKGFVDSVLELEQICTENNKHLILRDWPFSNFMPHSVNDFNPPDKLLTLEALRGKCHLVPFVFVRDAIDVWISRGMPPVDEFFKRYRRYIEAIHDLPAFKYEIFCRQPEEIINGICDITGIKYSKAWSNFQEFETVHGDIQSSQVSRGVRQGKIQPLPRKRVPRERIQEVNNCKDMITANNLLGYSVYFKGQALESIGGRVGRKVKNKICSVKNRVFQRRNNSSY